MRGAVFAAVLAVLSGSAGAAEVSGQAMAVDGDIIRIGTTFVRLYGIDAPERGQPCYVDGQFWDCQPVALRQLEILVADGPVTCRSTAPPDPWGRMLGVCEVDGMDLGEAMVRSGMALAYPDQSTDYVEAQDAAEAEGVGLWKAEFDLPWEFRERRRND